jgi:TrpR-related protein YerC/YecD
MSNEDKYSSELFEIVINLYSADEAERFFKDLMTTSELENFSQRLKIAVLLSRGLSYRQVSKETGASTTTVTRVNEALERGHDGLKLAVSRLNSLDNNEVNGVTSGSIF